MKFNKKQIGTSATGAANGVTSSFISEFGNEELKSVDYESFWNDNYDATVINFIKETEKAIFVLIKTKESKEIEIWLPKKSVFIFQRSYIARGTEKFHNSLISLSPKFKDAIKN